MIVTFKTKTWANIVMFGDVAVALLRMMGHSGNVPGALRADEVGPARERLRTALDALAPDTPSPGKKTDEDEPPVSIHQSTMRPPRARDARSCGSDRARVG